MWAVGEGAAEGKGLSQPSWSLRGTAGDGGSSSWRDSGERDWGASKREGQGGRGASAWGHRVAL